MIHRDTPGVRIEAEWWPPTRMHACVGPAVHFEDCLIPEDSILGTPGAFKAGNWLGKFHLAFTSNYLGAAQGMYDWIVPYMQQHGTAKDPNRQTFVGELKARLDATRLLVYRIGKMYRTDFRQAQLLAVEAKCMAQATLYRLMELGGDLAGSTAFVERYPLERFYRDMHVHGLHSRPVAAAQLIGSAQLGEPYDIDRMR